MAGPPASRLGDVSTGHDCFPSKASISGSNNVFINSIPAHRVGDSWQIHCCDDECHGSVTVGGSSSVFVNGVPASRIGDVLSDDDIIASGSPNVFIGG